MSNIERLFLFVSQKTVYYTTSQKINSKSGNNSLSYDERMSRSWMAEIILPRLSSINHVDQVELGDDIRIAEIDHHWVLHSSTGLAHIYEMGKFRIMDNHNHALYFRSQYMAQHADQNTELVLLHIDQHSDLNTPRAPIDISRRDDLDYLWRYTNFECQISSFIKPFAKLYPQLNFTWIKSESQLLSSWLVTRDSWPLILDIDLDFRAPEMSIANFDKTITLTRQLIAKADLVTIASSPLFIDQQYALDILQKLCD